jgi:hypothetical protein
MKQHIYKEKQPITKLFIPTNKELRKVDYDLELQIHRKKTR